MVYFSLIMGYSNQYTYGVKTNSQMLGISGQAIGETLFNSDTNKQHTWTGQFWLNSDMVVLTNTSGGNLVEGDVVKSNGNLAVTKSTASPINHVGVVVYSGTNNNQVAVAFKGGPYKVSVNGAASLANVLTPAATGVAAPSATISTTSSRAFGHAVGTTAGAGLCDAILWNKVEVY